MKYILVFLLLFSQQSIFSQKKTAIQSAEITFTFVSEEVNGSISGFESTSNIDLNDIANSNFKGSVTVTTIDTGNSFRNWSLKRGKYFAAKKHPKISFESTSISPTKNGFLVEGQLTIKATTKPITIHFTRTDTSLTGTTTLFSSDYGINVIKKGREKNKVDVKFIFQLK